MKIILLIFSLLVPTEASVWYASTSGNSTNGTQSNPWSVQYAVNETANDYLAAGDTVRFLNGTFVCTNKYDGFDNTNVIAFQKSGTVSDPITYEPVNLWQFSFDGGLLIPYATSNLVIKGFRIFQSATASSRDRNITGTIPEGIGHYGNRIQILHNLIENVGGPGIGSWGLTHGKYIAGNITRFIGCFDYADFGGAKRGSGMYMENDLNEALVRGNISYHNLTDGLLAKARIVGFKLRENIIANAGTQGLSLENKHTNGVNIEFSSNYVFTATGLGIKFGDQTYDDGLFGSGSVVGNYVAGGLKAMMSVGQWQDEINTNNVFVLIGSHGDGQSAFATEYNVFEFEDRAVTNNPTLTIGWNSYYAPASANNFNYAGSVTPWASWQTTPGDTGSTYTQSLPADLQTFVVRPSTDNNFVHVAVFNWNSSETVSVNLSSYFSSGDSLDIYDAQNIPTRHAQVSFSGTTVSLPLTLTDKASMSGSFGSNNPGSWNGFDARFRAFVIHRNNPSSRIRSTSLRLGNLKGR